ncbi:DUF742 domain-containing protein, partial [Streptomyces zingiberis]
MATPPDGYPYGGYQHQPQGDQGQNYGYSSVPGHQEQPQHSPYQQQAAHGRHDRYGEHGQYGQRYQQEMPHQQASTDSSRNPLVRPYAMTGGRTRPRYQLAIEALVHTTASPGQLQGQLPEHQRICHLCHEIKSVAEVSALLSIPLGVARILVADLAEAGLVAIHQPGGDESAGGQPD